MKALVGAFNQEKALVGAFSAIVQLVVEPMDRFTALYMSDTQVRGQDLVTRNLKRVVEVWLDEEHKQYFYTRQPLHK